MTTLTFGPTYAPVRAADLARLAPDALFNLADRVAVVTGAAGGIGQWLAAGLAAAGARLVLTDIDAPRLAAVADELATACARVASADADLSRPAGIDDVVAAATDAFGRLDILINCAAINRRLPIADMDAATYDALLDVDLKAPYFLAKAASTVMRAQGGGSIINIGSINVGVGIESNSVYGMAKAALAQVTKVMAVEWAADGVRVNCLCPGFMMTPLSAPVWRNTTRVDWMTGRIPLRRPGLPHELIGLCLLLASDAGSYLTGQTFHADGGFFAGSTWSADGSPMGAVE